LELEKYDGQSLMTKDFAVILLREPIMFLQQECAY
jgi:hypothetical protein